MSRTSSRDRLIRAARKLYAQQGITETTAKQIAELAEVNEVTLFRQFGSKDGLLLALLDDPTVFEQLRELLGPQAIQPRDAVRALQDYARTHLDLLEQVPEFIRSLIGESSHYPEENRQALVRSIAQIDRYTSQYLAAVQQAQPILKDIPVQTLASLLNCVLLGYAVLGFTSGSHSLWGDREAFLADVIHLLTLDSLPSDPSSEVLEQLKSTERGVIADLPANLVKDILQRAKKRGSQDYALAYVAFATGASAAEISALERWHYINNPPQHLLQIAQGAVRQVPMNQWVMGQRYGSNTRNPLTQWLSGRKDEWQAMFFTEEGNPASAVDIQARWRAIVEGLLTPQGMAPTLEQARQTWCVDMLMRGVGVNDLALLAGRDAEDLEPYARRAAEKAALERAMQLDMKGDR
ncbi:TetR/AcrR family transcriptional regulator [Synechococcus sp. PCC 7336]|uniref:TetR/AcrR family transcriptional regulator n=1 Tax=Synechococcus sp. PCC 7336 TaxID=195250 RepID=UPI00034961F5|nr:TetR/AcrR family transcriptional regulator [Synechococcus sp. PCC 7336]